MVVGQPPTSDSERLLPSYLTLLCLLSRVSTFLEPSHCHGEVSTDLQHAQADPLTPQASLPRFSHILELCLYCKSLPKSVAWYKDVLRLKPHLETPRVAAFPLGDSATLLLFQRGETSEDTSLGQAGLIPGHGLPADSDVKLKTHFALAVDKPEDVLVWKEELESRRVKILGEVTWPAKGRSVYFEDPDGHVGEVASRGIWPNY